jgi:hypothetical protein
MNKLKTIQSLLIHFNYENNYMNSRKVINDEYLIINKAHEFRKPSLETKHDDKSSKILFIIHLNALFFHFSFKSCFSLKCIEFMVHIKLILFIFSFKFFQEITYSYLIFFNHILI